MSSISIRLSRAWGVTLGIYSTSFTIFRCFLLSAVPGPVRNAQAFQVENEREIAIEFDVPEVVNGVLEEFVVVYTESRDVSSLNISQCHFKHYC